MNLQQRKDLLQRLGSYLTSQDPEWLAAKEKAYMENQWFLPQFIDRATTAISRQFLQPEQLQELADRYQVPANNCQPLKVGIVMAGNIPLVGFHDFLCVVLSGHIAVIKPSSRDEVLIKHIADKLAAWEPLSSEFIIISEMLRNCDAYIATGSNNSARYFEYYFGKYPSIIRRNRTSVAVLTGEESREELESLADDVYLYFGLGCRNVSKIYVPRGYDFVPLLDAFRKYSELASHHKYKNNYDYNLAVHMLNHKYYMTNESILLIEDKALASPISQLNYEFYDDIDAVFAELENNGQVQTVVAKTKTKFGKGQTPAVCDFADGVDTMRFLMDLSGVAEVRRP